MKKRKKPKQLAHKQSTHTHEKNPELPVQSIPNVTALFAQAEAQHQEGNLSNAEVLYKRILSLDNKHIDTLNNLGIAHFQRGDFEEGVRLIGRSLEINPNQPVAHNNCGNALNVLKRQSEALANYDRAIALKPDYAEAYYNRGNVLNTLNRFDEAQTSYAKAVAINSDYAEAHNNRGSVLYILKRLNEALTSYDRAIALKPDYAEAYNNRGNVLKDLKRLDEALSSCNRAIFLKPDYAEAYNSRGNVLNTLNRFDEALASYAKAIAVNSDYAEAHNNRGNVLYILKRLNEALDSYDRAIALKPDYAEAYYNRGITLKDLKGIRRPTGLNEALASYDRAIDLKPDYAEAYNNRGNVLNILNRFDEAMVSYAKAITIKPGFPYATGAWLYSKMSCCNWKDLDAVYTKIGKAIDLGEKASSPFTILSIPSTLEQQQRCARSYIADKYPNNSRRLLQHECDIHDRVRIGYFSSDFRDHPITHLMAELFECHDRSRFEVIGFSIGPGTNDTWRLCVENAFDRFFDVSTQTDLAIARLVLELEIDIAIDLNGHTHFARTGVFALHPAPVQVSYLGYIGTMGADYIDYIIGDHTVIPEEHRKYYDEKVVYLPNSYQVNNSTKVISDRHFTRSGLRLPEKEFVFCCFNKNYKITPDLFDIWMRILHKVSGSVLWLLADNATAAKNLHLEAEKRGVSPERLLFAPRIEMADYLARYRSADMFLDTFYYNAGTTASDALWAGLPVLTCLGDTFAGRMAASLLNAIGLPELIAHSHTEYEAMALELATQSERLAKIRKKLAVNIATQPLFDTANFTRHLEDGYIKMYERHKAGLSPDHIIVEA